MSLNDLKAADNAVSEILACAQQLVEGAKRAAEQGDSFDSLEREIWSKVRQMGFATIARRTNGELPKRPRPKFKHATAHFTKRYPDGDEVLAVSATCKAFGWAAGEIDRRHQSALPLVLPMDSKVTWQAWSAASVRRSRTASCAASRENNFGASATTWRPTPLGCVTMYAGRQKRPISKRSPLLAPTARGCDGESIKVLSAFRLPPSAFAGRLPLRAGGP